MGVRPEIVFVNCAKEIHEVLHHVGLTRFIKFERNIEKNNLHLEEEYSGLSEDEIKQIIEQRKQALDDYTAENDLVCYSMKNAGRP